MQISGFRQNTNFQHNSAQKKQIPSFGCFIEKGCGVCDELVTKINAVEVPLVHLMSRKVPLKGPYYIIHTPEALTEINSSPFPRFLTPADKRGWRSEDVGKSWILNAINVFQKKHNLNHKDAALKLSEEVNAAPRAIEQLAQGFAKRYELFMLSFNPRKSQSRHL